MRKTQIIKNKSFDLGLSILELGKIVMHKFWCGFAKRKYGG